MKKERLLVFALPILAAWAFSGCGVSSGTRRTASQYASTGTTVGNSPSGGSGGSGSSGGSEGSNVPTGSAAPYTFTVSGVGYVSKTVSVSAGRVLRVKVAPGAPTQAVAGTGYTAAYSAMGVYIGVGSTSQATPLLRNGYYGSAESTTMDLSSSLPNTCPTSTDPACRRSITVTVSKPNLDYSCLNYGMYCPYTQAPSNVPWNVTLTIQTDDTQALQ